MIRNFLKTAFRNLLKYKIFTLINISGLTLGITAVLLIAMYVFNESNFEGMHKNGNRIYRVNANFGAGDQPMKMAGVMPALGPAVKSNIPEVENFARFIPAGNVKINYDSKEFDESKFYYADPSIFDIFTFELLKGNIKKPFQNYNSIVITQSTAEKIFGKRNPLGQILHTSNQDFYVTAVAKDVPANTQMQWDFLAPIECLKKNTPNYETWARFGDCYTYLLLKENVSPLSLDRKINQILKDNAGPMASMIKLYTQKLTDIYLYSDTVFDISPKGNVTFVYLLSAVAILILVIATFNFVNLSTVRSIQRSKEVGLKKVLGATRLSLVGQFLCESFLVTFVAVFISVGLYYFLNPMLSDFLDYKIDIPNLNLFFYLSAAGIFIIVAFVSGIYPAFFLSKYKPVETLRGSGKSSPGKFSLRKVFVVFQFALSIVLISGTIAVLKQINYMKNADIGIDKSNIALLSFPASSDTEGNKYQLLKNKLLENPNIVGVNGVYTLPGINSQEQQTISLTKTDEENRKMIRSIGVDFDFLPMMKAKILTGRNFSREYSTDSISAIIINESAIKMLGLKNPVGTTVYVPRNGSAQEAKIIGVVKDFNIESLRKKVVPYCLYVNPQRFINIAVKIREAQTQPTLQYIKTTWAQVLPDMKFEYKFFEDSYSELYSDDEKLAELFTIFSVIAIIIACLGLLGLSSFTALMRTKEIGIRKVLGANILKIIFMLNKDYILWVGIAFVISVPAAFFIINYWLQNFAYRTEINWWIFILSGGVALVIALATVSFQAVKAAIANPVESLRYE
jgi:putative ABC transport system permease protein